MFILLYYKINNFIFKVEYFNLDYISIFNNVRRYFFNRINFLKFFFVFENWIKNEIIFRINLLFSYSIWWYGYNIGIIELFVIFL